MIHFLFVKSGAGARPLFWHHTHQQNEGKKGNKKTKQIETLLVPNPRLL